MTHVSLRHSLYKLQIADLMRQLLQQKMMLGGESMHFWIKSLGNYQVSFTSWTWVTFNQLVFVPEGMRPRGRQYVIISKWSLPELDLETSSMIDMSKHCLISFYHKIFKENSMNAFNKNPKQFSYYNRRCHRNRKDYT